MKDTNKEIVISTAKSIFGVIPYGGALLDELFFEYNGRIKQNRLNHFIEILVEFFTEDANVKIENIKTENFNDLFESVLRRVVQTKSDLKLIRFKDILLKELENPTEQTELIDLYLDLITTLSEEELIILYHHREFDTKYDAERKNLDQLTAKLATVKKKMDQETIIVIESKYKKEFDSLSLEIKQIKTKHTELDKYRKSDFYNIDNQKFGFYKQRLYSKGLLIDWGIGRIDTDPFEMMSITQFGIEFIEFIKK
ncbi:hypothetical protein ACE01N_20475 [Saccharicrinis sp. FJH2]|uniref:hypothetical protein n=1 Tax=Saccharicrinis sp. FJH65 TaxID=3344659 RepID=UPI0035F49470